jgi:hypothetical protein
MVAEIHTHGGRDAHTFSKSWRLSFKTMKSEFVAWQETISAKKYDLHDEKQYDKSEGVFTQANMNRSQQSWVKTFMQDVMDEQGQVLFDNLAWFAKKLCSVMTSASA